MANKQCPNCNACIDDSVIICPFCGTIQPVASSQNAPQQPFDSQQSYEAQQNAPQQPFGVQQPYTAQQNAPQQSYGVQQPYTPQQNAPQQPYGAQQSYTAQQNGYTIPQGVPTVPVKKSGKGKIIAIVAIVLVVLGIIGAIAGSSGGSSSGGSSSGGSSSGGSSSGGSSASSSYAYEKVFSDRNIVQLPAFFLTEGSAAFVSVDEDGWVDSMEFGYNDDVICEMTEKLYIDLSTIDESVRAEFYYSIQEIYDAYNYIDCYSVTYTELNNYYLVTMVYTDLDDTENLRELEKAEVFETTGFGLLSMEKTRDELLSDGYIEK